MLLFIPACSEEESPAEEELKEKDHKEKEKVASLEKPPVPSTPVTRTKRTPEKKKTKTSMATKVSPKGKKKTVKSNTSKKSASPPTKPATKSKKPATTAPTSYPTGPIHITGALRVMKSNFTIPKKQPQQKDSRSSSTSSSSSKVPVPSSPSSHTQTSSSRTPHPSPSPVPPPVNTVMRQNIRRSLTDILYKRYGTFVSKKRKKKEIQNVNKNRAITFFFRVCDSDDLKITEAEVAKLSIAIEKEMFNLCLQTDSKYKNKYRTLMFNLKDPKNKVSQKS